LLLPSFTANKFNITDPQRWTVAKYNRLLRSVVFY
jgi:hypothetical protein